MSSPTIGLKNLVYAVLNSVDDCTTVPVYGPVKSVDGIQTAKITPKVTADVIPGDDTVGDINYYNAYSQVEFALKYLPLSVRADWLGHTLSNGELVEKNTDIPPFIAIGFMSRKRNGHYLYKWFKKVQFQEPDSEHETLSDKSNPKYPTIKGMALPRLYDGDIDRVVDPDDPSFTQDKADNFFTSPDGAADTTAPTITAQAPAANATAVARGIAVVLTFSKALLPSTVTAQNIYLLSSVDGSVVSAPVTYNSALKQATVTPAAQLAATTKYIIVVSGDVTDMAGNAFAPANTTFTTGA